MLQLPSVRALPALVALVIAMPSRAHAQDTATRADSAVSKRAERAAGDSVR